MDKVGTEISIGRIMGPFQERSITNFHSSTVGVVPKADWGCGGYDYALFLFYIWNESINHWPRSVFCAIRQCCGNDIFPMERGITGKGKDVKSAFRLIPVHPSDFELLGYSIHFLYYVDKCLPIGCSISCKIWETFANFLHWLNQKTLRVRYIRSLFGWLYICRKVRD